MKNWIFLGMLLLSFLRNEGCLKGDAQFQILIKFLNLETFLNQVSKFGI